MRALIHIDTVPPATTFQKQQTPANEPGFVVELGQNRRVSDKRYSDPDFSKTGPRGKIPKAALLVLCPPTKSKPPSRMRYFYLTLPSLDKDWLKT